MAVAMAILGSGAVSDAQDAPAAATMSRDRQHLLVNKQLGSERWSISMNLSPTDSTLVQSITGNVFVSDDAAGVSFISCGVRPDSTGTLDDPESTFRLTCKGANDCDDTAFACARNGWSSISTDVSIAASFFLPPGGLGSPRPTPTAAGATAATRADGRVLDRVVGTAWSWLRGGARAVLPPAVHAQTTALAAATLSPDLLNHLVVRDLTLGDGSTERWSIAFDFVRDDSFAGGFKSSTVLGNVFRAGAEPSFVDCEPRGGNASLENPAATLSFSCFGTSGCTTTAYECADGWQEISSDVSLMAKFFLPSDGRGTPETSERGLLALGSDTTVPALASEQFQGSGGAECEEGEQCTVDRVGLCENIRGRKTSVDDLCRCYVAPLSPYCVRTGAEENADGERIARIPAACGEPCTFDVGIPATDNNPTGLLREARGVSLPIFADSPNCFCHANPPDRLRTIVTCGGVEGRTCTDGRCCVDDPRDGCNPLDGDAACSGICIAPTEDEGEDAPRCGDWPLATQFCGDGTVEGNEVCDPGKTDDTCDSLGFASGTLDCSHCVATGCSSESGDESPRIASIEVPATIDAYTRAAVRGRYRDADGDVVAAVLKREGASDIVYDVAGAGRRVGTFEVAVGCNGLIGKDKLNFQLVLRDAAGNESDPTDVDPECTAPPVCGDGTKTTPEQCDPASEDEDDACPAGQACANDCTCQIATSCAGRCCPELGGFCGNEDLSCRCDAGCRDRQDCCADAKEECGL